MGCGASKAVNVADAPRPQQQPTAAAREPSRTEFTPNEMVQQESASSLATTPAEATTAPKAQIIPAKPPLAPIRAGPAAAQERAVAAVAKKVASADAEDDDLDAGIVDGNGVDDDLGGGPPNDDEFEEIDPNLITEDTEDGERIADANRPPTPELVLEGAKIAAKGARSGLDTPSSAPAALKKDRGASMRGSVEERGASSLSRGETASQPRPSSGATIQERPSSRGGLAFDMTFEGEEARARAPARLESLRNKSRSQEEIAESLKKKLDAAEQRRQNIEKRLLQKVEKEMEKVEKVQSHQTQDDEAVKKAALMEKQAKVLENREAQLKALRDKLKAKEDRAEKVRALKRAGSNPN